uniref:Mpv17-like protein n=1 Tax=Caenorhabditis japonica TaxID=281687 RepID=A0A8R1IEG1_CAEJA
MLVLWIRDVATRAPAKRQELNRAQQDYAIIHFLTFFCGQNPIRSFFSRHLLLSNVSTSVVQIGTADLLQQHINGDVERNGWDWRRTCRMAAIGLVTAPTLHGFYKILDSRKFKGGKNSQVLKKLFWDTASIPFFSCLFITVGALYEGQSVRSALSEYRRKVWHIWKVDFSIWPPTQLINFYFVPAAYRIIYVNCVSLVYNCIMSYIKNNEDIHIGTI